MSILIFMQLRMKKSLFRFDDALELYVAYIFCFSLNTLFDYVTALKVRSYLLKAYFQSFIEYRSQIVFLFTFIVMVFHYQMLYRKKTEVFCRTLVGDTIFERSIGRTDLGGGDYDTLIDSIRKKVLTLPDETMLHPGHGSSTVVEEERKYNPFLREK